MSVVVDEAEKTGIITITRPIGFGYDIDDWNEDFVTAKNAGAEKILLRLNSPGGIVTSGLGLHDAIKNCGLPVTAQVFGEASSATTLVALGAERIEMSSNSLWMVHEMRGGLYGTETEMRDALDKVFHPDVERVVGIYAAKTGMSREAVLAAQKEEQYLSAQQAKDGGWVDAIIGQKDDDPKPAEGEKMPEEKPGMVRTTMERARELGYRILGRETPEAREMKATLDRLAAENKAAQDSAESARAELSRLQESLPELIDKAVATRIAEMGISAEKAPSVEVAPPAATMTAYSPEELAEIYRRGGSTGLVNAMLFGKNA